MEGLSFFHAHVKDLYDRARKLTSTSVALANLFTEESIRLNREDEASRLRAVHRAVVAQLEQAKWNEDRVSYAYSRENLRRSVSGLAVGTIIKLVSKNNMLSAISDHIFSNLVDEQRTFGTVMVCIGTRGIPGDVEVISISELARESNRLESDVIDKLREHGYLLLDEKDFSLLIDRLIDDVRGGRLHLPVSREKLSEIIASSLVRLQTENPQ